MNNLKYYLGFLWTLPVSIVAWIIVEFIRINRGVESVIWDNRLVCVVTLKSNHWFYRVFFKRRHWAGWSCGNVAFVGDMLSYGYEPEMVDHKWNAVTIHETTHCLQQYKWGILWYPVYIVESAHLWFKHKKKHSYLDNRFEREARRLAGQLVDIPPEFWPDGLNDRWIFW